MRSNIYILFFPRKFMSRKRGSVGLIVTIVLVVLIIVAIGFFALRGNDSSTGETNDIKEIMNSTVNIHNNEYSPEFDAMLSSYNDFYASPYTSQSEVDNGLRGVDSAKQSIVKINSSLREIFTLINSGLASAEGSQKEWFEKAKQCYDAKQNAINEFSASTNEYGTIIRYYEKDLQFWNLGEQFDNLRTVIYNEVMIQEDDDAGSETLADLNMKYDEMVSAAEAANSLIPLASYAKLQVFFRTTNETLALWPEVIDASSDQERFDEYKAVSDKETGAYAQYDEWSSQQDNEIDQWFLTNIKSHDIKAGQYRQEETAACDRAASLWASAYY